MEIVPLSLSVVFSFLFGHARGFLRWLSGAQFHNMQGYVAPLRMQSLKFLENVLMFWAPGTFTAHIGILVMKNDLSNSLHFAVHWRAVRECS